MDQTSLNYLTRSPYNPALYYTSFHTNLVSLLFVCIAGLAYTPNFLLIVLLILCRSPRDRIQSYAITREISSIWLQVQKAKPSNVQAIPPIILYHHVLPALQHPQSDRVHVHHINVMSCLKSTGLESDRSALRSIISSRC